MKIPRIRDWKMKTIGPLLSWTALYIIGSIIKLLAYEDMAVYFEVGPEASLWAVGVLFAVAISEQTYRSARSRRFVNEEEAKLKADYDVTLPDDIGFTPNFIYIFLMSCVFWIFTLLLSGYAVESCSSAQKLTVGAFFATLFSFLFATVLVIVAVRALSEVGK